MKMSGWSSQKCHIWSHIFITVPTTWELTDTVLMMLFCTHLSLSVKRWCISVIGCVYLSYFCQICVIFAKNETSPVFLTPSPAAVVLRRCSKTTDVAGSHSKYHVWMCYRTGILWREVKKGWDEALRPAVGHQLASAICAAVKRFLPQIGTRSFMGMWQRWSGGADVFP